MTSCFCADRRRAALTGFALALASLCRPDGALLALVLLPMLWWRNPAGARRAFLAYVCTLAPWVVFTLSYFHTVIPASVAAKAHTRLPVLLGSGISAENVADFYESADGFIIGSYFKGDGYWEGGVELSRVERLMEAVRQLREVGGRQ